MTTRKARKWWMAGISAAAIGGLWIAATAANASPLGHHHHDAADQAAGTGSQVFSTTTILSHGDVMLGWTPTGNAAANSGGAAGTGMGAGTGGAAGTGTGTTTTTPGTGATTPATGTGTGTAPGTGAVTPGTSTNWAGYVDNGAKFTSVSASWTQPTANCANAQTFSSFWVGLDGDGSTSVEQTGSEADCQNGAAVYFGWFEMFPAAPVMYNNPVKAGDAMSASVTTDGAGGFTLTLTDATQNWNQVTKQTSNTAQLASAEVIAEAPSSNAGVLPLTNFGTVMFSNAMANGAAIGTVPTTNELTMAAANTTKATPSALAANENFSVTFMNP